MSHIEYYAEDEVPDFKDAGEEQRIAIAKAVSKLRALGYHYDVITEEWRELA